MARLFSRRLSPLERLWLVADRLTPPFVNQLVLEGEGPLDEERWQRAAAAAGAANPGSQLVLRGLWWWTHWVDSGRPPPVRVVDGTAWDGHSPIGAEFLRDRMPPREGPTTEVLLVRGQPPRVVVRTHHAVMDGSGHLHWVADLFRCLRGEAPVGWAADTIDLDLAERLGAQRPAVRRPDCLAPTGESRGIEPGVTWRRVFVPGRYSHLLPRIAVSLAAQAREHGAGRVRIDVPMDLRQRVQEPVCSTANLTGMLHLDIEPDTSPERLSVAIREHIANARGAEFVVEMAPARFLPLWLMRSIGRSEGKKAHRTNRWITTGAVSNLGKVPLDSYHGGGFRTVTSFFVPPGTDGTAFFMALNGRTDGVELCLAVPNRLAGDGRIEACLVRLRRELFATDRGRESATPVDA